jgi:uncharacterized protein (TIGR03086 family)
MAHARSSGDPPGLAATKTRQERERINRSEHRGPAVEGVAMLQRVVDTTTEVIGNTTSAQLANPTLCSEWTVKDVINHMVSGATMFAISAEQGSIPDDVMGTLMSTDNVGNDPQGAWDTAAKRAMAAFGAPGVMEKIVKLPFGEMQAGVALNIAIFDVATHAVDLAKATGQSVADTELLEDALLIGQQMVGPGFRQPGIFDDAQPIDAKAPVTDRLLAFAGRKL